MNPLLDLSGRPVIAHRGASAARPENTLAAFELAVLLGADAIELDVHLSADGIPVVIHDPTLDRTTDLRGSVSRYTLTELRKVDAGARFTVDGGLTFPFRLQGVQVPTLAEVLAAFPDMPLLVDLKEPRVQEAVRRVLLDQAATERCVVASDRDAALLHFRQAPFVRAASRAEISRLFWGTTFGRVPASVGYRLLSVPERYRGISVPTRRFCAAAGRLGCPVHVWTVDAAASARSLWSRGVAGIVTNMPERIRFARDVNA
jgi:glycerophosphoryl diester phosphodiesterase